MKKGLKIVGITLLGIVLLGVIFFIIDYNRVQKQVKPIFCILNSAGAINDGGTKEYFGLGYKVIDFNRLDGYDEIRIGYWSMKYEDFKKEYENETEIIPTSKDTKLEDLPQNYSQEQAINDGCFVVTYNKIYNKNKLDEFIENTGINSKNRIEDTLRIVQFTIEGDMIIIQVDYTGENYKVIEDNTRDEFSRDEDRKITSNDAYPEEVYGIIEIEKENIIEVTLALYAEITYVEGAKPYEDFILCSYSKDAEIYY